MQLLGLAQQCLEASASPVLRLATLGAFSSWDACAKAALTAQLQLCTLMLQRCQV